MARGRMIHTRIWRSEKLSRFDLRARLLWIGLITNADDQGRGQAHPGLVRSDVFPLEDVPLPEIVGALEAFETHDMLILYQGDGKQLYQVTNWWEYQGAMSWAWPSDYPPPDGWADRLKYRKGNTVMEENWTPDGGKEDTPSDGDGPTVTPPRPHDEPVLGQAPNGNQNGNTNGSQNGKDNTNGGASRKSVPLVVDVVLLQELLDFRITDNTAEEIVKVCDPDYVRGWLRHVHDDDGSIRSPAAFLVDKLLKKREPPPRAHASRDDHTSKDARRRYASDLTMPIEAEPP